jgi:foldase protein PrsA
MRTKLPLILVLCAAVATAALVTGCGGVPGNAVAQVDGESIEKERFDHWMAVAAKSSGETTAAAPVPPDYKACIAAKRKALGKPVAGQPKTTDAELKKQCETEYQTLRDNVMAYLIRAEWLQREAEAQGIKVTAKEVEKKISDERKARGLSKEADWNKFLKESGQSEADIRENIQVDLYRTKLIEKISEGKDKVSDAQIKAYYDKNKARFATPEQRDLRIVLTKTKAKAEQAKAALDDGQSWSSVAKEYSIDEQSRKDGGKLTGVTEGTQEAALDSAVFKADKGDVEGPVKTQFGYYVFAVSKITEASQQSLEDATAQIKQIIAEENTTKALDSFAKTWEKDWKAKTECQDDYKTTLCENGPEATPTPTATAAGGATTPAPTATATATPEEK